MDEKYLDLIDRYLRKEMSPQESLSFEQKALNNPELLREVELTYKVKHRLADRQRKLYQTMEWEKKKRYRSVGMLSCLSIAAMLLVGIFFWKPADISLEQNKTVAKAENPAIKKETESVLDRSEKTIRKVRKSIEDGKDAEALNDIAMLEESEALPSLNMMAEHKTPMSSNLYTQERDSLIVDAYELHWLKIKAMVKIGKTKEALESLKLFSTIEGKYKSEADSLLTILERE